MIDSMEKTSDDNREAYRAGKGNWDAFPYSLEVIQAAASDWREQLKGIERPWLCWNVDSDWCLIQQRIVKSIGWTPVIGYDPRAGVPAVEKGALVIDFNYRFGFPAMSMMFPLEFVSLYCERLAFWHSDLLVRERKMAELGKRFTEMNNGATAAVYSRPGIRRQMRGIKGRYWELVGCTTSGASQDQFQKGAGWWRHIERHPNCPNDEEEKRRRKAYGYDHGVGILYWQKRFKGNVMAIREKMVEEGHCTGIGRNRYTRISPRDERRDLTQELAMNYDLGDVCKRLGLTRFL